MSKIVPMDELKEYDIWKRYISPSWSREFLAKTPIYEVVAIKNNIMLCLVTKPDTEEKQWRFVKITSNYTGYVDRVKLIARALSTKNTNLALLTRTFV